MQSTSSYLIEIVEHLAYVKAEELYFARINEMEKADHFRVQYYELLEVFIKTYKAAVQPTYFVAQDAAWQKKFVRI